MSKNKKKKNKRNKRTPEQQMKLREKRRKNRENKRQKALLIRENKERKELLLKKELYDNTTTKDFENWLVETMIREGEGSQLNKFYEPTDKMKMFFDEFYSNANMKEYTRIGRLNSFIHENGIVLLSNPKTKEEITKNGSEVFFNSDNMIYVSWICVDVDNKRKGWGTEMMNHLTELSRKYDYTLKLIAGGKDEKWNSKNDVRFSKYVVDGKYTTEELVSWYNTIGFGPDIRNISLLKEDMNENVNVRKILNSNMMYPSGSIEKYLKFPSLKGYDYKTGFSYSSTTDCMKKMIYGN
jgi:ribosomal protein S18 acetylase RimI-like enzyme